MRLRLSPSFRLAVLAAILAVVFFATGHSLAQAGVYTIPHAGF